MPDIVFDTLDLVPEGLKEFAVAEDGKFKVKVVAQVKLDEFRENNVVLSRERDTLKSTVGSYEQVFDGKPFDEFKADLATLKQVNQQVKDGTLSKSTDVEAEVARRVSSMRSDYERQLATVATENASYKRQAQDADGRYRGSVIDRAVTDAVLDPRSGANGTALHDILQRAKGVFQLDANGKLVAKDGEAVIYGADGATPMTPLEYLEKLKHTAPYFFKGSAGGGAGGGGSGGGGGAKNFGGYSEAEFQKLPAAQRLALARKHNL